jgi:hypothetical protein
MNKLLFTYVLIMFLLIQRPVQAQSTVPVSIFGTGVDLHGNYLFGGNVDPHYTLISSADSLFPGPNAYAVTSLWPTWVSVGGWIAPNASTVFSPYNAPGNYTYRTTFSLEGVDLTSVSLSGLWASDNAGVDILLNGQSTGNSIPFGTDPIFSYSQLSPFTISTGFINGTNTLDFVVNNATSDANPTGVVVQGISVTAMASSQAYTLSAVSSAPLSDSVRSATTTPVQAAIKDSNGQPVSGVGVQFAVSQDPSNNNPNSTIQATLNPAPNTVVLTDPTGTANTGFTAGDTPGVYIVTASCASGTTCTPSSVQIAILVGCQLNNTPQRVGQCDGQPGPWGGSQYAFHTGATMCQLGCGTTALSLGLASAGVASISLTGIPAPQANTPGSLNSFMVQQGRGVDYDSNNDVAWDVTTRDVTKGKLYFDTTSVGSSTSDLANAVCQNHAVIVSVAPIAVCQVQPGPPGGHYVIATGVNVVDPQGTMSFSIIDPGCHAITSLDAYGNHFTPVGFVSDPLDLSALDISIDDPADIVITDPVGNRTGFDPRTGDTLKQIPSSSYFRDFLTDNSTGLAASGVTHSIQILRPSGASYKLSVNGEKLGSYTLSVATFSSDGSSQPRSYAPGISGPSSNAIFQVDFSSTASSASILHVQATFASTLADISNSLQLGMIRNKATATLLSDAIVAASKANGRLRKTILEGFVAAVKLLSDSQKLITGSAPQVLENDGNSLLTQNP